MIISRIIAFLLLLLLSPLFLLIGIIILFGDGRPIIFKQNRIGVNSVPFDIYKFRTMKKNTPDIPTHLVEDYKPYYTLLGPLLRNFSLDEIPQLINIIKGQMIFIGPRPALYNQYDLINSRKNLGIDKILPGITGWAQVQGRDELSFKKKIEMDNYYFKNKCFTLDCKIIVLTIIKVFKSENVKI